MNLKASNIILLISIIFFSTTTSIYAFNITYFLDQHPQFSTFNNLLTKTGVAAGINKQGTVTVLVVDNSAVGPLTSVPQTTLGYILATHVILDYYDSIKLGNLDGKSVKATNLFQETGKTNGGQGLLNISKSGGDIFFGSTAKGAPQDSKMVKVLASQPFHISVIQISKPIVTPGLEQGPPTAPSSSPTASPPTPTAAPPPKSVEAPAPGPSGDDDDGCSADSPRGDSEGPSPAPASGPAPGPAPLADEADKEAPAKSVPHKNGGARLSVAGGVVTCVMGLVALAHNYL